MACKRLMFLGPPGSGKGTQAARVSGRFSLIPISSGDTLRNEIKAESEVGRKAREFVQARTRIDPVEE